MRDPQQKFIVTKISRSAIAEHLELARGDIDGPKEYSPDIPVTGDDDRLTDELCQEYADEWDNLLADGPFEGEDWFLEGQFNLAEIILTKMGYTKVKDTPDA